MKKRYPFLIVLTFLSNTYAQGPIDGFFSLKNDLSMTISYTSSNYEEFYVGEEKKSPVPAHNEVKQNIYSLYGKFGLSDNFSLILNLPYISATGKGMPDPFNNTTEQKDFQDLSLYGKYRPTSFEVGSSRVDLITALGFNLPLGYEPNGILSIGSGAFATNLHAGLHLQNQGIFANLIGGYSFKGEADNNFNVNGSDKFDVPNAVLLMGKLGYATSKFYIEGWLDYQSSVDGINLNDPSFMGQFPETEVDYSRLGITIYIPNLQEIGASAGYSSLI